MTSEKLSASVITFDLQEVLSPQVIEKTRYDAEIKDARNLNGESYSSIGNAIRGGYAALDEKKADKSQIGSPLTASSAAAMTDTGKIYVYVGNESGYSNGNWYYHNGSAWTSGGVYNSVAIGEKSITADKLNINFINYLKDVSAQTSVGKSYTHSTSSDVRSAPLSNVISVEAGVTYFAYIKLTISNLSGYTGGYIYLNWLNSLNILSQERVAGRDFTLTNGEIELYGAITPATSGTIKAMLWANNYAGNNFSYDFTVDKLYLIKGANSSVLSTLKGGEYTATPAYLHLTEQIGEELLKDGIVSTEKLSPELKETIFSLSGGDKKTIDCWGDSLTAGAGGNGTTMPSVLQNLLGSEYTVNNYGQGAETAEEIAFRQGGLNGTVQPFTVSDASQVTYIDIKSVNGANLLNLSYSGQYNGDEKVFIGGDEFYFSRGSASTYYIYPTDTSICGKNYARPMQIKATGKGTKHTMIICVGQNGYLEGEISNLISVIEQMIAHNGNENYLVIGRPTGNRALRGEEERALAAKFGNKFFNAREYISAYGMSDNSLTPSTNDEAVAAIGGIPPSLLSDSVHGNAYFYTAFAKGIYQAGKDNDLW